MVQPGIGGLDTPRTQLGDASFLDRQPDFDMSLEASFQSPSKDANLVHQLRNGGRPNLRTPRGSRAPFADRRNLPASMGGAEFTPMLKSATRNSARRPHGGKENGLVNATPAFLATIDENMTPLPAGESSVYGVSRNASSFMGSTPAPIVADNDDSTTSTPMVMRRRGVGDGKGGGPLADGNQLSLREQENVIDRIEKENFGLKLKIHFLEEALRKAGPGFSEAALKENTELKVDKVTMQRELQRYKKHLTTAEKDLESYRAQILEMQEKAKRKFADQNQRAEMERLRQALEEKEADLEQLQAKVERDERDQENMEKLQDEIHDLEADVRRKDHVIGEHEEVIEDLKEKVDEAEERLKDTQRRMVELEEKAQGAEELEEAKETIEELESNMRQLERKVDDMEGKLRDAVADKNRAEGDLEELQDEMSNKSMVTKGLSRQVEEKVARLQAELDKVKEDYRQLEAETTTHRKEKEDLQSRMKELRQDQDSSERTRHSLASKLEEVQAELNEKRDEKALLQTRHDSLTDESASLQREVARLQKSITELEDNLGQERKHALAMEHDIQTQFKGEVDRLKDEISDLLAECREKDRLYDNDSEKWETERQALESERDHAEERASGLQRTIDKLREVEGSLSDKETKLSQAMQLETERHKKEETVLGRQIDDLRQALGARQTTLEAVRNELAQTQDQLRQAQLDCQSQTAKVEALEDEVEVLQATLDEESEKAQHDLREAYQECDGLKRKIKLLQEVADSAQATKTASQESARSTTENFARLGIQLQDATNDLAKATKDKQALQDQLVAMESRLRSLQDSLAETKAEREDLEDEVRQLRQHGQDTFRLDQERLDLRSAKAKVDSELRRLKEENAALADQRRSVERSLEQEIEKAAAEEDRLNQEILQLQAKMRQSSEKQDVSSSRRTIRELERRIEDYEIRLAAISMSNNNNINNNNHNGSAIEGNSELSLLHRDLSAARQKELEFLQREATQKDSIKVLRRQVADLERKAHEAELERLIGSPSSAHDGSAQKTEVVELRHQLAAAHTTAHELRRSLREAEHKTAATARELQARLDELEEQRFALEQAVDDAQAAADEAATAHEATVKKYKTRLERYKQERDELSAALREERDNNKDKDNSGEHSLISIQERRDLHAMLRESQTTAEKLHRQVREQRDALDELASTELALRKKLERARSERAAYRASAERLAKDVRALKAAKDVADAEAAESRALVRVRDVSRPAQEQGQVDTGAIIRASEAAERRHEKEIRGMVMQMEWLKACWDREAKLRSDAAFAKRYLLLELHMRDACNKADLAIINRIRSELNPKSRSAIGQLSLTRSSPARNASGVRNSSAERRKPPVGIQRALNAVRFVVRLQMGARDWARHDRVRQRLADCVENMEREERIRTKREEWRARGAVVAVGR